MHAKRLAGLLALLLLVFFSTHTTTAFQTLIPTGASWKFNDSGVAQAGWTTVVFNDAAWPTGPAQLGYGDGDEATTISYGTDASNKRITAYFRRAFTIANPAAISALTARFVRDDGVVIYLNGAEVLRSNMPAGTIAASTLASSAIVGADESAWNQAPLPISQLVAGTNVIAVEVHQNAGSSSDLSFDFELQAADAAPPPPAVTLVAPLDHAVVNTTTVNFEATATAQADLASAALLVGGPPVTVSFSGTAQVQDAQITADTPTTSDGANTSINVDGEAPHAHALMKFPTLIGAGAAQVPAGASIASATLHLDCTDPGAAMQLYRLTQDWSQGQATWNQRASGAPWGAPGADGTSSHAGVAVSGSCDAIGLQTIDLTRFVQEWASGLPNYGVVFTDSGTNGIDFTSSEGAAASSPVLTVTYRSAQITLSTQPLSGTSANITLPATLPVGTYFWNVRVSDINGQSSLAPADFELRVDTASPNPPAIVLPTDGATNVPTSTNLQAVVGDPSGGTVTATATIRKAAAPEFTIIALPDTQYYSEAYPEIFTAQTQWIVNNKTARNIVFVTHEGDVVENQGVTLEWQRANTSMSLLDGVVPYGIGPGNHDLPTTNFNIYFPWTRYSPESWYGGHYQNTNDNNFQLFSAGGIDFVILHLVFCPSAQVVAWADSVLKAHPDRIGIMTTHAYLNEQAQRTAHGCTNTQYLWDDLAVPNPNLHFMLSGHVHDESRRTDIANGHPVHQMLADYQSRVSGGQGWLRILRFVPTDNKVYVQTYSPWLNQYETDANSEFTLDFPMAGPFVDSGAVSVASGGTATFPVSALEPLTPYDWQVTVTNAAGRSVTSPLWRFTTDGGTPVNHPPTVGGDAYSIQAGQTLSVPAAGVLANDTDPESSPLAASLVTDVAHGTLSLLPNGSFTYTPLPGYTGPDGFTYRANDGQATSSVATVSLTVTAAGPTTLFNARFTAGPNSFVYADDVFNGTAQAAWASGTRLATGGFAGGALQVLLGGIDDTDIFNMSGGWQRKFTLASPATVTLSFRYRLNQGSMYELTEYGRVLARVDGTLLPSNPGYVAHVTGDGDGGAAITTGWQQVQLVVGSLSAGTHTLTLGGFSNQKTTFDEETAILFDDVVLTTP